MSANETWIARVRAAAEAADAAMAVLGQAVSDAAAAGVTDTALAQHALGTQSRERVAALRRAATGLQDVQPRLTPVIYLRGAGCGPQTWMQVEQAMRARGWATLRNRTGAWHLARGGTPVVLVDFSTDVEVDEHRAVEVSRVRARYGRVTETSTVGACLPTETVVALQHADPDAWKWLDKVIAVERQDMEMQVLAGGLRRWPYAHGMTGLDEQVLARWVAEVLAL